MPEIPTEEMLLRYQRVLNEKKTLSDSFFLRDYLDAYETCFTDI